MAALAGRVADAEKQRSRTAVELAAFRGREAFRETAPSVGDLRIRVAEVPTIGEEARAEAQAFAASGKGVMIAWCGSLTSVLLACSPDSGIHAGNLLKPALTRRGGRGGGSAQMAQGGVPDEAGALVASLEQEIRRTAGHSG